MFPIFSISGRVLGFSGRILSKEKQAAKYVNSPDSEIYNKSHILYGLYQARNAISRADKCYLVEGNVDVVSMHQSGVCNTVASCGTSLTTEQIRLIKRYTPNVTVLYDGDSAGIKAALRAVNLLFEESMHVRVVLFPDGEDPDSYAQKYGSTQLQEYLRTHEENFVKFKTRVLLEDIENDPIRKAEVLKEIVRTIAIVPDMIERQEYIKQTSFKLNVSENILTQELAKTMANNAQKAWKEEQRRNNPDSEPASDSPQPSPSPSGSEPQPIPDSPLPQHQQPTSDLATDNNQIYEQQIIRLLINYGAKEVLQNAVDDQGNPCTISLPIAEIIVSEINDDDLSFNNALFQKIFNLYRDAVLNHQPLPDANYFAMNPDPTLRNTALTLMLNPYNISPLWLERKNIAVPSIETHLRSELEETILTFKQKKIEQLLEKNAFELRSCSNPDDTIILMAQRKQLTEIRQTICQQLNRVII